MHFVANGPTEYAKVNIDAYREALSKRGGAAQPKPEFKGGVAIGALRHIVLAETDAEAEPRGRYTPTPGPPSRGRGPVLVCTYWARGLLSETDEPRRLTCRCRRCR